MAPYFTTVNTPNLVKTGSNTIFRYDFCFMGPFGHRARAGTANEIFVTTHEEIYKRLAPSAKLLKS